MFDCVEDISQDLENTELRDTVHTQLQQLMCEKGDRYDPARFRFIESLLARSTQEDRRVAGLLERKAQRALQAYEISFRSAKTQAKELLLEIEKTLPGLLEQAQSYFDHGEFDRLQLHLSQQRFRARHTSGLTQIIEKLSRDDLCCHQNNLLRLDELLLQQEARALEFAAQTKRAEALPVEASAPTLKPLKSNLRYQESQRARKVNDFMTLMRSVKPSNPGPLNPERLFIELLQELYALSPEYFIHYLDHLETLLWLEKRKD